MRRSTIQSLILCSFVLCLVALRVWAFPEMSRKTKAACASCHVFPTGGAELTAAGKAYHANPAKAPAASAGFDYVGSQRCRSCHPAQHKAWSATEHATAMKRLHGDDEKIREFATKLKVTLKGPASSEDGCVKCHVTGFKLAGGYPAADSARNANLGVVGCESCHGPGGKHAASSTPMAEKKKFITRAVSEKMCRSCHTPVTSPDFDLADYLKKGVH